MRHFFLFLLFVSLIATITLRVRYGGGEPYPDISTDPILDANVLEEVLSYDEPIGNVAISADGRIFFTVHPESRPQGNKLLEWVAGAAVPYPNGTVQPHMFDTVLGLVIDRQNRLWTIDNGNHGFGTVRLVAFDLNSGNIAHDHEFGPDTAPAGSFLQDLQVTNDGETVLIADASIWRKQPAIVVYDIATRKSRRVLENHVSVSAQDYVIRTPAKEMSYLGGLVNMKTGVDGIALDADGEWLYYGAMNHSGLFRIRVDNLRNSTMPASQLARLVERFADKPLSDGLSTDTAGTIYITDVEHGSVVVVDENRNPMTLIQSPRIRWADGLSFGPDGWLYVTDSALPQVVLQSQDHIRSQSPYHIFRFQAGTPGIPGR